MSSQGPNFPSTATDQTSDGGANWSNPSFIGAADTNYATCSNGQNSDHLNATNYGFSVPGGATILGVVVSINRKSSQGGTKASTDLVVSLIKGGTIQGNNYASGSNWPTTIAAVSYGTGTTDLWGLTLTSTDVNASNFGASLQVEGGGTTGTQSVDYISITVYFSGGSSGNSGGLTPLFNTSTVLCPIWNPSIGLYDPRTSF